MVDKVVVLLAFATGDVDYLIVADVGLVTLPVILVLASPEDVAPDIYTCVQGSLISTTITIAVCLRAFELGSDKLLVALLVP